MIGSKVVAKSVFYAKNTIEFWDCGNSLTTMILTPVEFEEGKMKPAQMHSLYHSFILSNTKRKQ